VKTVGFEQFMNEYGIHLWIILGILFGIGEVLTVAFFALPFALGAFFAAAAAWLGMSFNAQLAIFAIASLSMLFIIQLLVRKYFTSSQGSRMRTNSDALVGEQALVIEPVKGKVMRGAVKIGGEVWTAIADGEQSFEPEQIVKVLEVQGAKLLVGALDAAPILRDPKAPQDIA
jgi:membrane protein implicated in regulation of membrane protease activity